jgi:hypothetical protein
MHLSIPAAIRWAFAVWISGPAAGRAGPADGLAGSGLRLGGVKLRTSGLKLRLAELELSKSGSELGLSGSEIPCLDFKLRKFDFKLQLWDFQLRTSGFKLRRLKSDRHRYVARTVRDDARRVAGASAEAVFSDRSAAARLTMYRARFTRHRTGLCVHFERRDLMCGIRAFVLASREVTDRSLWRSLGTVLASCLPSSTPHLVEAVDVPDNALGEDLVFVEGDEHAKRSRAFADNTLTGAPTEAIRAEYWYRGAASVQDYMSDKSLLVPVPC